MAIVDFKEGRFSGICYNFHFVSGSKILVLKLTREVVFVKHLTKKKQKNKQFGR